MSWTNKKHYAKVWFNKKLKQLNKERKENDKKCRRNK